MRYLSLAVAAVAVTPSAAFPTAYTKNLQTREGGSISGNDVPDVAQLTGNFDAEKQYIETTGQYEWRAPGPNDIRGPCPGLNALANHGYLPRNGVANQLQFVEATYNVFGMGRDLGGFLAVIGTFFDGNLNGWSIGGPSPLVPGGNGLTGSHNKYENDVSPTRGDLYMYGSNQDVVMKQWEELYAHQANVPDAESNYNLKVLQEFRSSRWDQSVNENPYFFQGPFSGVLVQPAAFTFIYRYMSNKSAEHPEGQLTKSVLKSFFGITEHEDGSFSGGRGFERIPDNWYKRSLISPYNIPFFLLDVLQEASVYPKFLNVGGNTGTTNSFQPLDLRDPAGGLLNQAKLLEGNNLFCFAFQSFQNAAPDQLLSLTKLIGLLGGEAGKALSDTILSMGCPELYAISEESLKEYPGYQRSLE